MDWDDLQLFLAIARHGTLSAAARALGVTQPTMGRRLAAMEARTGARLLQRLPGGYALTPLGESVIGHAERIEAEALAAERMIRGRDIALAGVVRLTTIDILATRFMAPALAALQRSHPGLSIELAPDTRTLSLSRREADIAVRLSRFESQEVFARRIGVVAMGLYVARTLEAQAAAGQAKLIDVLDDQAHLPEAKWLHACYPDAETAFRSNSRDVMLSAAREGAGIAALPRFMADGDPGLVRLDRDKPPLQRDIWLGVHGDMRHMPRIRAVIDAISDTLARHGTTLNPGD